MGRSSTAIAVFSSPSTLLALELARAQGLKGFWRTETHLQSPRPAQVTGLSSAMGIKETGIPSVSRRMSKSSLQHREQPVRESFRAHPQRGGVWVWMCEAPKGGFGFAEWQNCVSTQRSSSAKVVKEAM